VRDSPLLKEIARARSRACIDAHQKFLEEKKGAAVSGPLAHPDGKRRRRIRRVLRCSNITAFDFQFRMVCICETLLQDLQRWRIRF
jgi:hypothetical protein